MDKSGNKYNASNIDNPSGTSQYNIPFTTTNPTTGMPGIACSNIFGTGMAYQMSIPPGTFITAFELYMVHYMLGGSLGLGRIYRTIGITAPGNPFYCTTTSPASCYVGFNSSRSFNTTYTSTANVQTLVGILVDQPSSNQSQFSLYANGSLNFQSTLAQRWVPSDLGDTLTLCSGPNSPLTNAPTVFSEILIYNKVLSSNQRQSVEGYLATKWGLQSSLPPTHPYYSTSQWAYLTSLIGPAGSSVGPQGPQGPSPVLPQYGYGMTDDSGIYSITFNSPFVSVPVVTVNITNGSNAWATIGTPTIYGCAAYTWNASGACPNTPIYWTAVA
jgi:hypothetical protein